MIRLLASALAALLFAASALAIDPDEQLDDPTLEARARAISKELRCPICQSQSIDESNVEIAKNLRLLVRERVVAGDTDQEVLDYVAARYGDYVLLSPPMEGRTVLLWLGPLLFLALGGAAVWFVVRQARSAPIDPDEELPSAEGRP